MQISVNVEKTFPQLKPSTQILPVLIRTLSYEPRRRLVALSYAVLVGVVVVGLAEVVPHVFALVEEAACHEPRANIAVRFVGVPFWVFGDVCGAVGVDEGADGWRVGKGGFGGEYAEG